MKREGKSSKRARRGPVRRILRGALWLAAAFILFHLIAAAAPFVRQPTLDADTAGALERRADAMQRDVDTDERVMLMETSQSALDERIRLIEQAREEIIIVTYECHDGESTRDILAAALDRAAAGVRVRFLVDGIAGRLDHMDADLFRAAAAHPNVEVRFYNLITHWTPWKHMGRMHDKYVIVDHTAYILGGRNMFDKFIGCYPAPVYSLDREALVYANGAGEGSLAELRAYFEGMWNGPETTPFDGGNIGASAKQAVYDALSLRLEGLHREQPELFEPCDYAARTLPTRGIWLVSNPTGIYAKAPVVFGQLCALMRRAKDDVIIHSPYAVLNRPMREALSEIAARVPVTLMVNAVENGANLAASGDYLYHRDDVRAIGVRLLEYAGGISYHGKAAAIDDALSVIGSFNMDMRSAYIDTELMLVIRGREVNAALRENLSALHDDCRAVDGVGGETVPDDLVIPTMSPWKRAALYVIGALLQPVRWLV